MNTSIILDRLSTLFPENGAPIVRAVAITSLDGYLTRGGRSGGLGGQADARLMSYLRRSADVILVSASTATHEGYTYPLLHDEDVSWRQQRGLSEEPAVAVVTRSSAETALRQLSPGAPETPRIFNAHEHPEAGSGFVPFAVSTLQQEGYRRIVVEGGPKIWRDLIAGGKLDEISLTMSPVIVGDEREVRLEEQPEVKLRVLGSTQLESFIVVRYAL